VEQVELPARLIPQEFRGMLAERAVMALRLLSTV